MFNPIMSAIDDCQSLGYRINSFMMSDISCDQNIRILIQCRLNHTFTGTRTDCYSFYFFFQITEYLYCPQMKCRLHIFTAFSESHRCLKIRYSSDPFGFIFFPYIPFCSYFQNFCILHIHLIPGKVCHSQYIIIRMHSIIRNIVLYQF